MKPHKYLILYLGLTIFLYSSLVGNTKCPPKHWPVLYGFPMFKQRAIHNPKHPPKVVGYLMQFLPTSWSDTTYHHVTLHTDTIEFKYLVNDIRRYLDSPNQPNTNEIPNIYHRVVRFLKLTGDDSPTTSQQASFVDQNEMGSRATDETHPNFEFTSLTPALRHHMYLNNFHVSIILAEVYAAFGFDVELMSVINSEQNPHDLFLKIRPNGLASKILPRAVSERLPNIRKAWVLDPNSGMVTPSDSEPYWTSNDKFLISRRSDSLEDAFLEHTVLKGISSVLKAIRDLPMVGTLGLDDAIKNYLKFTSLDRSLGVLFSRQAYEDILTLERTHIREAPQFAFAIQDWFYQEARKFLGRSTGEQRHLQRTINRWKMKRRFLYKRRWKLMQDDLWLGNPEAVLNLPRVFYQAEKLAFHNALFSLSPQDGLRIIERMNAMIFDPEKHNLGERDVTPFIVDISARPLMSSFIRTHFGHLVSKRLIVVIKDSVDLLGISLGEDQKIFVVSRADFESWKTDQKMTWIAKSPTVPKILETARRGGHWRLSESQVVFSQVTEITFPGKEPKMAFQIHK
jgi:hypothetical protein